MRYCTQTGDRPTLLERHVLYEWAPGEQPLLFSASPSCCRASTLGAS